MTAASAPHRVLVLQRVLPAYRLGFFQALAESPRLKVTFAYGAASKHSAMASIMEPPGLEVIHLGNSFLGRKELAVWQRDVSGLLHAERFDAVIAEYNPRILSNLTSCLRCSGRGLPFIWWGHGFGHGKGRWRSALRLWLAKKAKALILYNQDQAARFVEAGVDRNAIFVAPNSLDTDGIGLIADEWEDADRYRVLYIGRLYPDKKVDLLLRGFAKALPVLEEEILLTLIGDGPQRRDLERLAKELGIAERVQFLGAVYDQAALAPYFNSALVSVSPGCVGLSAIHSLAYGVPMIVADDEPHGPERTALADEVNMRLFRSDEVESLATVLIGMLEDDDLLWEMSEAAREVVREQFGLPAMVRAFEQAVRYAVTGEVPSGSRHSTRFLPRHTPSKGGSRLHGMGGGS